MLKENAKTIDSKSLEFKQKVIDFGRENIGRAVTFKAFEEWLNKNNCYLINTDMYWKAVFTSILKYSYNLDFSYRQDKHQQIVTVFRIES